MERLESHLALLQAESSLVGSFFADAEKLLQEANAYTEPRSGEARYNAIFAGILHLAIEVRRWKLRYRKIIGLSVFTGVAIGLWAPIIARWIAAWMNLP
jgi:hypothetical protein